MRQYFYNICKFFRKLYSKPFKFAIFILLIALTVALLVISFEMVMISDRANDLKIYAFQAKDSIKAAGIDTARVIKDKSTAELLLKNTNEIMMTVYFGTADLGEKKEVKNFTAFSMIFEDKFYIITAGHCIEYDGEKYSNFKFRANNSNIWIKPKLLDYKNDSTNNNDYAIFYNGPPVSRGLIPAKKGEDLSPQYVLGNLERGLNFIKQYNSAIEGESGSPILNSSCHVSGVIIKSDGSYTPVQTIIEALYGIEDIN